MKHFRKNIIITVSILLIMTVIGIPSLYIVSLVQNKDTISTNTSNTTPVYDSTQIPNLVKKPSKEQASSQAPTEPEIEEHEITLMAVGDNLFHMGVINTGKMPDGSLDYTGLYDGVRPYLDKADIKIINQETILGGNERGFSGFPNFNSPTEVGDSLSKAGFNVVLHASNHSADQGISGIDSCINFWGTHPEILVAGIHAPDEDDIPLMEIDGIKFAILNYTYGPNYEVVSSSVVSRLNILCDIKPNGQLDFTTINPRVLEDIKKADELADIVIVCPHWGTEYATTPSSYQKTFAMQMTQAGADLIIGTHPHVVQPVEWIEAENGNSSLCYYSLGNYVSTQKNPCSMLEALAWVSFSVSGSDISINKEKSGVLPLVCHYSYGPVRIKYVYALEDYTQELASQHGIIRYGEVPFNLSELQKWSEQILGSSVLSSKDILNQD